MINGFVIKHVSLQTSHTLDKIVHIFSTVVLFCLCFCVLLAFYLHCNLFPRLQRSLRSHAERTLHSLNIQASSSAAHFRVKRGNFVWPHYGTLQMSCLPYWSPQMKRSAPSSLKMRRTMLSGEISPIKSPYQGNNASGLLVEIKTEEIIVAFLLTHWSLSSLVFFSINTLLLPSLQKSSI